MTPSDWIRDRRHHDNVKAAGIIAMALKPRVRVKAQGIPLAVTPSKPKPTKKGAKK